MTYECINGWNKKSFLDYVNENFKEKSMLKGESKGCAYRGTEGNKCSVGIFIPDSEYSSSLENTSVDALPRHFQKFYPLPIEGMLDLQIVHDNGDPEYTFDDMIRFIEDNVK